jgi:hypothetical protein
MTLAIGCLPWRSSAAFDNHALAVLRAHVGAWHCVPCWARAAGLSQPESPSAQYTLHHGSSLVLSCGPSLIPSQASRTTNTAHRETQRTVPAQNRWRSITDVMRTAARC